MGVSAFKGPIIGYGTRAPLGSGGSENPDLGPSLIWGGTAYIDPRVGYNVTRAGAIGLGGESAIINQVPSAISAVNIAASQSPGAGAINLVTTSGAGITVLSSPVVVWASGNTIPSGALAIDGLPGLVSFGLPSVATGNTKISMYDPTKAISRNVRIVSGGNDSGITFTVNGYDLYGYPQTATVTGANIGTASTTKTFKFVTSVVASGSVASTVTIGTGDVMGFPMLSSFWGDVDIIWNNNWVTVSTGYTAADTTSPATSLTGDVRGTMQVGTGGVGTPSNGTIRLMVYAYPSANNLALNTPGIFGQTPA